MIFSKVTTLPMVSLTRHEDSIKAGLWHTFNIYMIFFQIILFQNLSPTIAHFFFFAKKLSKLCFSASGNSAENKSVLSFHPFLLLPKDSKD